LAGEWVQQETSAAAYAGLLATLLVAPIAFSSRRHLSLSLFAVFISVLGLSWCLKLPLLVNMLSWPGLNLMFHNRFVFVACFWVLALAAVGLDVVFREGLRWQKWMWLPVVLLAGIGAWCSYRTVRLPEPWATQIERTVAQGGSVGWVHSLAAVKRAQAS